MNTRARRPWHSAGGLGSLGVDTSALSQQAQDTIAYMTAKVARDEVDRRAAQMLPEVEKAARDEVDRQSALMRPKIEQAARDEIAKRSAGGLPQIEVAARDEVGKRISDAVPLVLGAIGLVGVVIAGTIWYTKR